MALSQRHAVCPSSRADRALRWEKGLVTALVGVFAAAGGLVRAQSPGADAGSPAAEPNSPTDEAQDDHVSLRFGDLLAPDRTTLTGDWGGARTRLEQRGVRVYGFLNDQYGSVLKGGLDTEGSGRNAASIDLFITADLEKLGVIRGGEALLHLQSNWGDGINLRTGSLFQVNDDADGDLGFHVAQFWYRQYWLERRVALTLGYLDYQTIIDRNEYANSEDKQFLHQALDNNPLLPLAIGLGATVSVQPCKPVTLMVGVADAQSVLYKPGFSTAFHDESWTFGFAEGAVHWDAPGPRGTLPGNYRVGVVYDPRAKAVFVRPRQTAQSEAGEYAVYVSADQMLWRERADSPQGLGAFLRFGYRRPETNRLARFWSGGLTYRGLLPGRDADEAGLGVAFTRGSDIYRAWVDRAFGDETVYELYYSVQVTKWLTITPDVQYIHDTGADGGIGHSIAGHVRVRVAF